jgi:phosphoglycolate phosphatase-like HAD superfamily hydrolase
MLIDYPYIFLDFDGVIKDSVEAKSQAFETLFMPFGEAIAFRVRRHHEENSGVSRYEKLPIYLQWAEMDITVERVADWSERFSLIVKQRVIDSEWVPGVLDFLQQGVEKRKLFVVTATPQAEIEEILEQLGIIECFSAVIGAPTPKIAAIQSLIQHYSIRVEKAVMIGDAGSDYEAAKANQVDFILRRTELNRALQGILDCPMVNNFLSSNEVM